jgi:heptosyltransferase-3
MKKIAIFCANGIGDFILMTVLAFNAKSSYQITIFHPFPEPFRPLFPHFDIAHADDYHPLTFDLTIVENDHSAYAFRLADLRKKGHSIIFIFPKPSSLYQQGDFLFDQKLSFTKNLLKISKTLFQTEVLHNGMDLDDTLYRVNRNEVLIHPSSKNVGKIWPMKKFLEIYHFLERKGFSPKFVMSAKEKENFDQKRYEILSTPTLYDLAKRIKMTGYFIGCDSGPGHMASALKIPTLTIFPNPKLAQVWHPCFFLNVLATPPFKIPRIGPKDYNLMSIFWHRMIPCHLVKKKFLELVDKAELIC